MISLGMVCQHSTLGRRYERMRDLLLMIQMTRSCGSGSSLDLFCVGDWESSAGTLVVDKMIRESMI